LEIHHDFVALGKVFAVALAVGLDVLAISVSIGVAQLPFDQSLRLGMAFAGSEITMQVIGTRSARVQVKCSAISPPIWASRCLPSSGS
jgi:putative Mn2+ efflux pump MntP